MNILALDTSTAACSTALWLDGEGVELFEIAENRHSIVLLPMIQSVLDRGGIGLHRLDVIAFGEGPGSFTGLRVGVGVAQAIAFGAGLPVLAVSSLHAQAYRQPAGRVLAAFDARMGQVYWCTYRAGGGGTTEPDAAPGLTEAKRIQLAQGEQWFAVGSGCDRYRAALETANPSIDLTFVAHSFPHAMDIARLADEAGLDKAVAAENALPRYVRNQVTTRRD